MDPSVPLLPFWCHVCEVGCNSALNLQTHFLGMKHSKLENAIKEQALGKDSNEEPKPWKATVVADSSRPPRNLEEQLDRSTEPAVGLEYLEELRCPGRALKYVCRLCDCEVPTNTMFMHVMGTKHRMFYLTKHYPEKYLVAGKRGKLRDLLRKVAAEVEAKDGRKKIRVVNVNGPPNRKNELLLEEEAEKSRSVLHEDFTVDDFAQGTTVDAPTPQEKKTRAVTPAPEEQELSAMSLELKKAQEALEKKQEEEKIARAIGTFKTNSDLLDYLDKFMIVREDDLDFVLTVNKRFTSALEEYQAECERKAQRKRKTAAKTKKQKFNPVARRKFHQVTRPFTAHQRVCIAGRPQKMYDSLVPMVKTNSFNVRHNATASSKPAFYNPAPPWINAVPAAKGVANELCSYPTIYDVTASPKKVENTIAYQSPTPVHAIQQPNGLPKVMCTQPVYYNSTPSPVSPLTVPPLVISAKPVYYNAFSTLAPTPNTSPVVVSSNPVYYNSSSTSVPTPHPSPVVISAKPMYYNSSPTSVPTPKLSPVVISAKPVYYNVAKASSPESKPVDEKVVKVASISAAKQAKKRKL